MLKYITKLSGKPFVRNVAIVATGTAGAQVITIAFSPVITRLYGPAAFGALGTFMAILAVLTPLTALSYPISIVLPKRDTDAVGLAKLSMRIAVFTSLLTTLALLLFKEPLVSALNLQIVEAYLFLLPLAMLFSAAFSVMNQWVIRKKLYKINAKVAVLQALWLNGAKTCVGLVSPAAVSLVVLATFGNMLHALMLWAGVRRNQGSAELAGEGREKLTPSKTLAWRHRDFAYYRTPQILLNAASQSMPVLMLASFFGPAAAGFYSLGKMVLAAPTTLIGQSVAAVFYPRINEAVHNGENAHRLLLQATSALAVLGLIPFGIIVIFGPWLFGFVFGPEWHVAGVYAQWLALWSYFGFINRPSVGAIPVLSLQGFFLIYEVISVAFRASALFLGFWIYENALVAIALFSIVSAFLNASLILATFITARRHTARYTL